MRTILRGLSLAFLFSARPLLAADAPRPNIIILLADDLGWTDIHTGATNLNNGDTYVQTPAIDGLATQGLSFSNMHTCPNCAPARAALMTGQYAVRNGVYNVGALDRGKGLLTPADQKGDHIKRDAVTIAETLRAAGYATCHVGKFHVSNHAEVTQFDGFDVNYGGGKKGDATPHGYFAVHDDASDTKWTFTALGPEMNRFATPYTQEYVDLNLKPYANGNDPSRLVGTPKHLTDADADAAIDFLTHHLEADKDKPFFMNVAFNAVHAAIKPRRDLYEKYYHIQSTDPRHGRADFAALTEGEDQAIARILRFLDEHHLADNTLVLFTSDNGGSSAATHNDPLRGYKGMFYEGGLRVPAIFRLPGSIKPGTTTDEMANFVDFYPTFAALAGAKLPDPAAHPLDGQSLLPLLRGESKTSPRNVTYYHFPGYLDARAFPCSTIIKRMEGNKNYKLFYSYEDRHYELYNLTDDLGEKTDLLKDGHPTPVDLAIAANLRDDLRDWLGRSHPLLATDPSTKEVTPLPIPLADAFHAGNKITRSPSTQPGESAGAD